MVAVAAAAPVVWPSNEMEIGFTNQAEVTLSPNSAMNSLTSWTTVWKKSSLTPATNCVFFGMACSKLLKNMVHWAKDFNRIDEAPTLDDLDAPLFLGASLHSQTAHLQYTKYVRTLRQYVCIKSTE
jgi:hypothetical protein